MTAPQPETVAGRALLEADPEDVWFLHDILAIEAEAAAAARAEALVNAAPALARIEALETALDQPPSWQRATCCSFAIGSHYNRDGTVGGDLVPPHEPTIDPLSGVVMLDYRSVRALLESRG